MNQQHIFSCGHRQDMQVMDGFDFIMSFQKFSTSSKSGLKDNANSFCRGGQVTTIPFPITIQFFMRESGS